MTCVTALGSTILSLVLTSTFIFPLLCMHVLSVHAHVFVRAADGCECVLTKGSTATLVLLPADYHSLLLMLVMASLWNTESVR